MPRDDPGGRVPRARVVAFRCPSRGPDPSGEELTENGLTVRAARRLRLLTRAILGAGFGAALVVYALARARPENPLGYDPLETKKYVHDLQVYGGTANVLAAQFREWFAGLWYGKNLAYTIAVLTVAAVGIVRFYVLTSPPATDERGAGPGGPPKPVA